MNTDVVGRGRDGDRSGAPDVGVAQLVGQLLQLVRLEPAGEKGGVRRTTRTRQSPPVVIPENVVVSWSGGSLDSLVRAEIEVELCRMSDPHVHCGPGWDVSALSALLLLVGAEQSEEKNITNQTFPPADCLTWCGVSSGPQ